MVFNDIHKKILDAYLDPFLYADFFNSKNVSCLYPPCLYPPCLEHFKIVIFFYVLHNSIGFNKKSDLSIPNKLSYGY